MVFNKLNTDLLAALRKYAVYGVGLSGIDGGLIRALKRPVTRMADADSGTERDVDFGYVGDVAEVNRVKGTATLGFACLPLPAE